MGAVERALARALTDVVVGAMTRPKGAPAPAAGGELTLQRFRAVVVAPLLGEGFSAGEAAEVAFNGYAHLVLDVSRAEVFRREASELDSSDDPPAIPILGASYVLEDWGLLAAQLLSDRPELGPLKAVLFAGDEVLPGARGVPEFAPLVGTLAVALTAPFSLAPSPRSLLAEDVVLGCWR